MKNIVTIPIRISLVLLLLVAFFNKSEGQTGLFYYPNPSGTFVNNKLVALTQAPNQEIYLLGKLSTASYEQSVPYFCRVDKRGNLLMDQIIDKKHIYDLNGIYITDNQNVKLFGSVRQGPIFAPWWATLKSSGDIVRQKSDYVVYSTILNDVSDIEMHQFVLAETRMDNDNRYNINLIKVDAEKDEVQWSKKIKSDRNEEASNIIQLSDGSMMVLGKKYTDDLSDFSPVLYKVNSKGVAQWRVNIPVPDNFYAQDIKEADDGGFFYMCSYSKESMGTNETRILKLDADGKKVSYNVILDISGNGFVLKENGEIVLYGSSVMVHKERVVTKGKYVLIDNNLKQIYAHVFSQNDKPDSEMPKDVAENLPTNSDLTSGILLADGRVAIAGRIYMPENPAQANVYGNDRNNFALLLLLNQSGRY
ncbi:MAG: hypothetical protein PF489_04330 [Salinivirgaceae bacterium]|nr:hypothetical protein [Salinivirgaceae bacterium]